MESTQDVTKIDWALLMETITCEFGPTLINYFRNKDVNYVNSSGHDILQVYFSFSSAPDPHVIRNVI
jgi:hypothetical protein